MGKVYEKIKQIHIKYNDIMADPSEKNIHELYRYLDEYGLIKRTNPKRVQYFINGLKKELPTLNKYDLHNLKTNYYNTIWALQTGEIIYPFSIIPNIDGMPWPTVAAKIISKYPIGVGSKISIKRAKKSNSKNKRPKKSNSKNKRAKKSNSKNKRTKNKSKK